MIRVRDLLREFNLDNTGVLLALEKYARRPSLPWYGEAFSCFAFIILWLATAALALGSDGYDRGLVWAMMSLGAGVQMSALFWYARKPNVWALCVAPALLAVGSATAAVAAVFLTGNLLLPLALVAAMAVALGRIKLSFAAAFVFTILALTLTLGACRELDVPITVLLGAVISVSLLLAFALFWFPEPHWDLRPQGFALLAFGNLLFMASYVAVRFEQELLTFPVGIFLKVVGWIVASFFLMLLTRGYDAKAKCRTLALCVFMLPAVWFTSAGAIFAAATAILGFIVASRALMIIGFMSAGVFVVLAFVDVAAWITSSGFLALVESVLLLLWRW